VKRQFRKQKKSKEAAAALSDTAEVSLVAGGKHKKSRQAAESARAFDSHFGTETGHPAKTA